ncbi:hypothetical protein FXO37_30525 [Capsicum annuum]|nr:hypothetical protein FXO37_30525 [Capsicum annuum]
MPCGRPRKDKQAKIMKGAVENIYNNLGVTSMNEEDHEEAAWPLLIQLGHQTPKTQPVPDSTTLVIHTRTEKVGYTIERGMHNNNTSQVQARDVVNQKQNTQKKIGIHKRRRNLRSELIFLMASVGTKIAKWKYALVLYIMGESPMFAALERFMGAHWNCCF